MKLEKAIEILKLMGTPDFTGHTEDILAARKLGIEAMIFIQLSRLTDPRSVPTQLQGETTTDKP